MPRYAQFSTLLSHGLDLPLVPRCVIIEHFGIAGSMLNCSRVGRPFGLLRKSQREDPTEDPSHAVLSFEPDLKMIAMLTGPVLDCRPHYISSSLTFVWSETTVKPSREGLAWWRC